MRRWLTILPMLAIWFLSSITTVADTRENWIDAEYVEYCEEIGEELGISPTLLVALIETESSGKPNVSNGNCIGLMGVSYGHAQDLANEHGLGDVWQPYANIYTGALILLEKSERDKDIGVALSYYKGYKPSTVDRYVEQGKLPPLTRKVLDRAAELERLRDESR